MSKKIAIIGAGGHGKVVGDIAFLNRYEVIHFFDDQYHMIENFPFTLVNTTNYLYENIKDYDTFFVAIGDNNIRSEKIELLKSFKLNIASLIHPKSTISQFSILGSGICVMANAVINPGASIKEGVIINTSSNIDHDCIIGEYAHISPNCSLSGNVKIGKYSHIGTGTSIHPGVKIGNCVKTGVGSKVFKDIFDNVIYYSEQK